MFASSCKMGRPPISNPRVAQRYQSISQSARTHARGTVHWKSEWV